MSIADNGTRNQLVLKVTSRRAESGMYAQLADDLFGGKTFLRHGPILLVLSLRTFDLDQDSQVRLGGER